MASITSGEMTDCDWLRSTFSCPLHKNKRIGILKQNSKTIENLKIIIYFVINKISANVF
jgi:hypothetical protein